VSRKIRAIPGGLHPPEHKNESNGRPIVVAPLAERYIVPMRQHIGEPAQPVVKTGDRVLKGQMIGAPEGRISAAVHAPTSGRVAAVEQRPIVHPSGLTDLCVVIETDGQDEAVAMQPIAWRDLEPGELYTRLTQSGLAGQGGAVFPSHIKLIPGGNPIQYLILNGAECEPWITCDDRLMRERAEDILHGAAIMQHAIGARHILIGTEDNKPEAAEAMRAAAKALDLDAKVVVVPTRYPSGGAKQLTQLLTGVETPSGKLATDIGIQVFNVGTAYSMYRAVELGEPMISRIVTVTGHVSQPGNFEVRIGTPIQTLLDLAGGELDHCTGHLVGGPMMGFELGDATAPVVKSVNCIIAKSEALFPHHPPAMPCIRCGQCALACPAQLQPFDLYWHAKSKNFDRAEAYHLFDCIECGCCSYVCPSHIPLVDFYRFAKSEINARNRDKRNAELARERHEYHELRLEREKKEKAERLGKKAAERLDKGAVTEDDPEAARKKALLEAAIAKAKQAKEAAQPKNVENLTPEQQRQVEEIEARRKRESAAQQNSEQQA